MKFCDYTICPKILKFINYAINKGVNLCSICIKNFKRDNFLI